MSVFDKYPKSHFQSVPVMNVAYLFPEFMPARIQRAVHEVLPSIKDKNPAPVAKSKRPFCAPFTVIITKCRAITI